MRYIIIMEPANTIIIKLGGAANVAEITGVHRTRVYFWKRSKDEGGTGGTIPQQHFLTLLAAAKEMGVELSADDFLPADQDTAA